MIIGPVQERERRALLGLAVSTGLFALEDAEGLLSRVVDSIAAREHPEGHAAVTCRKSPDGQAVGWSYYAPDPYAEDVWNVWWTGVSPSHHGKRAGQAIHSHVEQTTAALGARVIVVETSDQAPLVRARKFYLKSDTKSVAGFRVSTPEGIRRSFFCVLSRVEPDNRLLRRGAQRPCKRSDSPREEHLCDGGQYDLAIDELRDRHVRSLGVADGAIHANARRFRQLIVRSDRVCVASRRQLGDIRHGRGWREPAAAHPARSRGPIPTLVS